MPLQKVAQRYHVFSSFERIVVVRIFTQVNSAGPKQLITLAVANAHTSPVVAVQEDKGPAEAQSFCRRRGLPAQQPTHCIQHGTAVSGWCTTIISQPPSVIRQKWRTARSING